MGPIRRISLVFGTVLLASCIGTEGAHTGARRPPNILFILADDLGYGDLGCYGAPDIRTPVIDGLAAAGVRFTQFYARPECTPTRAMLLTGRYEQRIGGLECAIGIGNVGRYDDAIRLAEKHELGLPSEEETIVRLLKNSGYATGLAGKWHLGYEPKFSPLAHGFDEAFYCAGGGMDYFHHVETNGDPTLFRNGKSVREDGYFTDLVANDGIRFLERHRAQPFFLYLPFTAPHAPFQGPQDWKPDPLPADSPLHNQGGAPHEIYVAMIERMDFAIGRVLSSLESLGLSESTLVIFASDNGGTRSARNAPLSGFKGDTYEGGIRVPCIARWPGVLRPGTVTDRVAIMMDLSVSMTRVAGARPSRSFDGIDILRDVEEDRPASRRTLFSRLRRGDSTWRAVRDSDLKYVSHQAGKRMEEHLFDLAKDPSERTDIAVERSNDMERLRQLLSLWESEVRPRR
jgi:N-acetylgalactosamine-6-sulfatase